MKMKGAQILVEELIHQGVETIFGYPGGTVIDIYDALCQKIAKEYSEIKYNDLYIDGNYTLNENLSDIAGVSCIISLVGEDNEKLGEMFEAYAKIWRIKSTEAYDKNMIMTDNHSPNKIRVNRVLSNFEAFENFYKIKEGDGMYIPDEKKIDIWG